MGLKFSGTNYEDQNGKKSGRKKIKRRLYVRKKDNYTEDFRFFKIFLRTYWMRESG